MSERAEKIESLMILLSTASVEWFNNHKYALILMMFSIFDDKPLLTISIPYGLRWISTDPSLMANCDCARENEENENS